MKTPPHREDPAAGPDGEAALEALLDRHFHGLIEPGEHAALEAMLRSDAAARRRLRERAAFDAGMRQWAESRVAGLGSPWSDSASVAGTAAGEFGSIRRRVPFRSAFALAACAALGLSLLSYFAGSRQAVEEEGEPSVSGCATLTRLEGAAFDGPALREGDTLAPGRIELRQGLAQIEFFSGASALVEGPATLELVSAWELRCLAGRVRVLAPPAAKGFLLRTPDLDLEDLGTEFAVNVDADAGASAVHVFEGEVVAHAPGRPPESLIDGMGLASSGAAPSPEAFLSLHSLGGSAGRHAAWLASLESRSADPRLVALYAFESDGADLWDRRVASLARPLRPDRDGGAVGARWTEGRWPGKRALEFKRPGDRLRLQIDGSYEALTFACWVKVDAIDKRYNGLLLTDGYDSGEPHWQIHGDGALMFSIIYRPENAPRGGKHNQMYFSPPLFTNDRLGRWHHLAVTYDNESGEVAQFFDGREVSREVSPLHVPGRPIAFGPCEIGNWGLPTEGHPFPVRNLNGAIDEFAIYQEALEPGEIAALFESGRGVNGER